MGEVDNEMLFFEVIVIIVDLVIVDVDFDLFESVKWLVVFNGGVEGSVVGFLEYVNIFDFDVGNLGGVERDFVEYDLMGVLDWGVLLGE